MRHKIALFVLLLAAFALPVFAVDGPQTDIYYYEECTDEVGYKWKDCGNSAWQMTGVTGRYAMVRTFDCQTGEEVTKYYDGCLTNYCEMTEQEWIDMWMNCS